MSPIRPTIPTEAAKEDASSSGYEMGKRSESEHVIHRLLLMSYFPSGFWSRLLTRDTIQCFCDVS